MTAIKITDCGYNSFYQLIGTPKAKWRLRRWPCTGTNTHLGVLQLIFVSQVAPVRHGAHVVPLHRAQRLRIVVGWVRRQDGAERKLQACRVRAMARFMAESTGNIKRE